jgi:hypothetical protein
MSLEAKIEALTVAIEKNNALLEKANSGRDAAIAAAEKLQTGPASTAKATKATKAAEPTAAAEPAAEDYSGDAGFQKVRTLAAEFLSAKEEAVLAARKTMFAKAIGVATSGATKLPEVAEADRGKLADMIKTLLAGGTVEGVSPAQAEEDDMLG